MERFIHLKFPFRTAPVAIGHIFQIAMTLKAKERKPFFLCCFGYRSDSIARTYKGAVPVQHPVKDPAAARRDQGCQAAVKRDEEGEGVPHHL